MLAAALALYATCALGDGGRVRLRQEAGAIAVTVFTSPEPLTPGPADVSVLVQDRTSGQALLDAEVEIRVRAPGSAAARRYLAAPGTNRLLMAAAVELTQTGDWRLEVVVRRADETVTTAGTLPVEPQASRLFTIWPFLAAPPLAIALFALQSVVRRRPRSPLPPSPLPSRPAGGRGES